MNYAFGHAMTSRDLFVSFPIEKLKMSKQACIQTYPDGNKRDLCALIFTEAMKLVVEDIIENNTHFKFPPYGRSTAYLYMGKVEGDLFKKAFKRGKWNDVDFITSNFTGYQLTFRKESEKGLPKTKWVYLASKNKDRITELTNEGKQY